MVPPLRKKTGPNEGQGKIPSKRTGALGKKGRETKSLERKAGTKEVKGATGRKRKTIGC